MALSPIESADTSQSLSTRRITQIVNVLKLVQEILDTFTNLQDYQVIHYGGGFLRLTA